MICIAKMKSRGGYFAQLLPYKDDYMHALICGSGCTMRAGGPLLAAMGLIGPIR
jgi:hypothetical protein